MYRKTVRRATVALVFIILVAATVACGDGAVPDEGGHASAGHNDGGHSHDGMVDLSGLPDPPNLTIVATPDGPGAVALEITVDGLELVPVDPPQEHQVGQGHAHVTVDGTSVAMVAETHYRLTGLSSGSHVLEVSLSSNDHRGYMVDGMPISVSMTLVVDAGVDRVPDHRFELEVVGGKIVGGPPRLEVAVGDLVEVTVRSDAADYVHLHVYDVSMAVHPGVPAILRMVAAIPGVFEAEMHGSGLRVFELRVS